MKPSRISTYKPSKERHARLKETLARFAGGVPRPEYPRPTMVRQEWANLNGAWEFALDPYNQGLQAGWQHRGPFPDFIVVPFAPQTELSCKSDRNLYDVVWYARDFDVPASWRGRDQCVLLHFGAVDYRTTVWVNGEEVGHNQGGQVPFSLEITPFLKPRGANRLVARVEDRQDPYQPRGKQSVSGIPRGCDYYCTTGIWQTVWMEPVPAVRINEVRITPLVGDDPAEDGLAVAIYLHAPATGWRLQVEALDEGRAVASIDKYTTTATARVSLRIPYARRWSPESPHLYDVRVRLVKGGNIVDEVESYAGVRGVRLRDGRVHLNGEPVFLKMVLDQGYWPDGGMTAPSDEALRADVEWAKRFGFNGVRKHQKVEDPRWLYWCDRLGLMVWGEMANARAWSPRAEEWFLAEWERAVRRSYNHPCIVTWVPLNESWGVPGLREGHPGQYSFVERIVALTRRLDSDRPVVSNDGWEQASVTDIIGIHDYTPTAEKLRRRYRRALRGGPLPREAGGSGHRVWAREAPYYGQPIMLTEVGGFLQHPDIPKDQWDVLYSHYGTFATPDQLGQLYRGLMQALAEMPFLAGFCYTQLTDIEQERNGLLTYDRRPKVDPEQLAEIHRDLFSQKAWERLQEWRVLQLEPEMVVAMQAGPRTPTRRSR